MTFTTHMYENLACTTDKSSHAVVDLSREKIWKKKE
jgi:hypothetical protein